MFSLAIAWTISDISVLTPPLVVCMFHAMWCLMKPPFLFLPPALFLPLPLPMHLFLRYTFLDGWTQLEVFPLLLVQMDLTTPLLQFLLFLPLFFKILLPPYVPQIFSLFKTIYLLPHLLHQLHPYLYPHLLTQVLNPRPPLSNHLPLVISTTPATTLCILYLLPQVLNSYPRLLDLLI